MSKHFLLTTCLAAVILSACSDSGAKPSTFKQNTSGSSYSEPELPPQENLPEPPPLVVEPQQQGEKSMSSTPQVELKLMPSDDAPREPKSETSSADSKNLATPLPQSNIPQTANPQVNLPGNDFTAVPAPATNPFGNSSPQTSNPGADPFSNSSPQVPNEANSIGNSNPQTTTPTINSPVNSIPQTPGTSENSPAQP